MKTELQVKQLLESRLDEFKYYNELIKTSSKNKNFNKLMSSTSYGCIVALLEVLNNEELKNKVSEEIKNILDK